MKPNDISKGDDSIAKADAALRRSRMINGQTFEKTLNKDFSPKKKEKGSLANIVENIGILASVVGGARAGFSWLNENAIQPVLDLPYVGKAISAPFKITYDSYYRFTHPYENETAWQACKNGAKNFFGRRFNNVANHFRKEEKLYAPDHRTRGPLSRMRAGIAAFMTTWALAGAFSVPVAGDSFRYLVSEPLVDGTRIALTVGFNGVTGHGFGLTRDTLYFGVPSKETGDDIYHVTASTQASSDESNSVSFEVRDRLLHEAWSWANGHGPFRPDYVVGPIRPDSNKCETVSYGSRFRIARWASFRPDMLSVACESSHAPTPAAVPAPTPVPPAPAPQAH